LFDGALLVDSKLSDPMSDSPFKGVQSVIMDQRVAFARDLRHLMEHAVESALRHLMPVTALAVHIHNVLVYD